MTREGKDREDNVVRFPRDWVGPLDELVPVGSRASAPSDEADSGNVAPTAAANFWDEGAAAVHEAVAAPVQRGAAPDDLTREDIPDAKSDAEPSPQPRVHGRVLPGRLPRPRRPARPRLVAALATGGAIAAAAIAVAALSGTGHGHHAPATTAATGHSGSRADFASDPGSLVRLGSSASVTARHAYSAEGARIAARVRQSQRTAERALQTGVRAESRLRIRPHRPRTSPDTTQPTQTTVSGEASAGDEAPTATTPSAPVTEATPPPPVSSAPTETETETAPAPTTSTTASAPSSGSDSGSGSGSGSTTKAYGVGGLLGAGHSSG